ncbi:MAG: T9SS type A sorting domain-containing protein [candidate division Zixibacteria bacterium]|nr:T9SS type A sorting domain-containing protein [candidate division Zixibacteria bacterium]MDH3939092.1 T9SS type A sorting domain-containing protein [candidate division Zixibacteria bacterium]MDH4032595.1 T9SS type A sorting domain-containing protein [candidate division Zixibacteria bacterium]
MRICLALLTLVMVVVSGAFASDAYYQEQIDDDATLRWTSLSDDSAKVYWSAVLPGNDEFGQATSYLSFVHSVNDIDPSLIPDGVIRLVKLKLFLHNAATGELEVTVDSLDLDSIRRRHFLIGPDLADSISVHESVLEDGDLEIVISGSSGDSKRPDPTFVLRRSVLDVSYTPALPMAAPADGEGMPESYILSANYPNPFNPSTTIEYNLPTRSQVRVEVLNALGQTVRLLVDAPVSAGLHRVVWDGHSQDGTPVASGVYYYRIVAGDLINARKMILLK